MLASVDKRKKIRNVIIIASSRAVTNLSQNPPVSSSIEETLSNQLMSANPIMFTGENSWSVSNYDDVWTAIEAIESAYGTAGENNPSQGTLESLSGDLATALSNAGL